MALRVALGCVLISLAAVAVIVRDLELFPTPQPQPVLEVTRNNHVVSPECVPTPAKPCCLASQSQSGEENLLRDWFNWGEKLSGTYVEMGALDGYKLSNTLALATCQKWSGVLIEADPTNFALIASNVEKYNRPNVTSIYGAVCTPPKTSVFFLAQERSVGSSAATGGVEDEMLPGFKAHWHPDGAKHGKGVHVPCQPMSQYLDGVSHVDLFSLDVEGAELVVLETIDFTRVTIDVFVIEFDAEMIRSAKGKQIMELLEGVGYKECETLKVPRSKTFARKAAHLKC